MLIEFLYFPFSQLSSLCYIRCFFPLGAMTSIYGHKLKNSH